MRYLKNFKLFETIITDDVWDDIDDILLELRDDGYQIHKDYHDCIKVSNKLCDDVINVAILHGTNYEFNYSNIEEVLRRLIDYMTDKGWQYSIRCKTRGGIGIQSYTEIECNGKLLADKPVDIVNCQISFFQKIDHVIRESNDDADTMARYQLFEANCEMAFEFDKGLTTDINEIKMFIEKYNETVVKSGQWMGGPVNREFVNFWNEYYKADRRPATTKAWKPTVCLLIMTHDYGTLQIGYSMISKKPVSINWGGIKFEDPTEYDEKVMDEILKYARTEIDDKDLTIDETIEHLQLNVKNKVDWEWQE